MPLFTPIAKRFPGIETLKFTVKPAPVANQQRDPGAPTQAAVYVPARAEQHVGAGRIHRDGIVVPGVMALD